MAGLQWLMGPSDVSDVELDDGSRLKSHGVKIERCRVLEQSGDSLGFRVEVHHVTMTIGKRP